MRRLAKIVRQEDFACDIVDTPNEIPKSAEDYYKSDGFDYMEVEQAWNGQWHLAGYCPEKPDEAVLEDLRQQRLEECFWYINRGQLWYESLTAQQKAELKEWYQAWLDAPETRIIPEKPNWLK